MQIFELTQSKKTTLKEYDPNRSPPKKNFGAGVGPGVQPQYTATPRMKATPTPGAAPRLPAPAAGAVTTTASAPKLQTIDAPPQLTGPTAAKQIGTNYDSNVIDVEAKPKLNKPALPAPAAAPAVNSAETPATSPAVAPTARQASQGVQSYQDTAAEEPTETPLPTEPTVAPAPSTPGVQGSKWAARIGSLGNKLAAHNAASVGLSVPDTEKNNPYGDQRAAAAKASAPLISQQARQELAKWNKAVASTVKQAGVAGLAQLPPASRNALELSLMNQVTSNFLQGKLGKDYRQLPKWLEPDAQQEAAAQIAKLDNAIKAIMNFDAPKSGPEAELQRWQDLAQATYDMRSLMQFHGKSSNQSMPDITNTPDGSYYIGNHKLNIADTAEKRIATIIQNQTKNGQLPDIFATPLGTYQIGDYEFDTSTPASARANQIIKSQLPGAKRTATMPSNTPGVAPGGTDVTDALESLGYPPKQAAAMAAKVPPGTNTQDAIKLALAGKLNESLTWSRSFDPSRTLLKKIRQL